MKTDSFWMKKCLTLAQKGAGSVSPNPLVGAVVVGPDGTMIGQGWHTRYGSFHAEVEAISKTIQVHNKQILKRSTIYVNLEPCCHFGKTPPCSQLIIDSGIPKVVVGMVDPFSKVAGKGINQLRQNGIEVVVGVEEHLCKRLNESFIHHLSTGRPLVTIKYAQTLDGAIATVSGDSKWISSIKSRKQVHKWRSESDAILVGAGTALSDNPALTVRHTQGKQPLRVIIDRKGLLPANLVVFTDRFVEKTLVVTAPGVSPLYRRTFEEKGGRVIEVETSNGHIDLMKLLEQLGGESFRVQSLFVESGPALAAAFYEQDLVDRLYAFIAPKVVGGGLPPVGRFGITEMSNARTFSDFSWKRCGPDMLFSGFVRSFK